jgi:hypothetical protein
MDLVSAFGLAANVLQVVETAIRVTGQIKEIHDRGSLSDNDDVSAWAKEVSEDNNELQQELRSIQAAPRRFDRRILDLAKAAATALEELKILLNKITFEKGRPGVKASTLKQICKTYFKRSQIERLSKQLQDCENTLSRTILKDLYVQCGKESVLTKASFTKLDTG